MNTAFLLVLGSAFMLLAGALSPRQIIGRTVLYGDSSLTMSSAEC